MPRVSEVLDSAELIQVLRGFDQVLILDPEAESSITERNTPIVGSVAIVVGPEGGISEEELAAFAEAGFSSVHLGSGVLRTSTAGMAAISFLQAKLGEWS